MFDAGTMALAFLIYSLPPLHFGKCLNELAAERLPITTFTSPADVTALVELPSSHKGDVTLVVPPGWRGVA